MTYTFPKFALVSHPKGEKRIVEADVVIDRAAMVEICPSSDRADNLLLFVDPTRHLKEIKEILASERPPARARPLFTVWREENRRANLKPATPSANLRLLSKWLRTRSRITYATPSKSGVYAYPPAGGVIVIHNREEVAELLASIADDWAKEE